MRAKHSQLTSLRNRLIAALIVTAMLLCTALCVVVAMIPAEAEGSYTSDGGVDENCPPTVTTTNLTLTDDLSRFKEDDGVATYVGGNMYIGSNPVFATDPHGGSTSEVTSITGSYAVEAEGLTLVNGRLLMRQEKRSWGGNGFRFGVVGFGSQYRPATGGSVLAVKGEDVNGLDANSLKGGDSSNSGSYTIQAWAPDDNPNGGDYGGGWFGVPNTDTLGDNKDYKASVLSSTTIANQYGQNQSSPSAYTSLAHRNNYDRQNISNASSSYYTQTDSTFKVMQSDGSAKPFSDYVSTETTLSSTDTTKVNLQWMSNFINKYAQLNNNSKGITATSGSAPQATSLTRYKYDYYRAGQIKTKPDNNDQSQRYDTRTTYKLVMDDSSTSKEKLITLQGNGTSNVQVFQIPVSYLSGTVNETDGNGNVTKAAEYTGISWWFKNIPDSAAVFINVVNDDGTTADNTIDFHNGWRIWWTSSDKYDEVAAGKTQEQLDEAFASPNKDNSDEIGGWYSHIDNANDAYPTQYAKRAQQVVWNFPYTTSLTIRGGQGSGQRYSRTGKEDGTVNDSTTPTHITATDDPAASWIGSIYVPKGSFDSHVTTNGRVYVAGDFLMDNPTPITEYGNSNVIEGIEGRTASLIDMDQERHNMPAPSMVACSAVSWGKADDTKAASQSTVSSSALAQGASTWGIYATLDDAKNKTTPVMIVSDNGENDQKYADGGITQDAETGVITVTNLKTGKDYFIRELIAPSGYRLNQNIYHVKTEKEGYGIYNTDLNYLDGDVWTYNESSKTWTDASSKTASEQRRYTVTSTGDAHLNLVAVGDEPQASVRWEKTDSDTSQALGESEWMLKDISTAGDTKTTQGWTVGDNTIPATYIRITLPPSDPATSNGTMVGSSLDGTQLGDGKTATYKDKDQTTYKYGDRLDVSGPNGVQLKATVYSTTLDATTGKPEGTEETKASQEVQWSSSNPGVASVSEDGLVYGLSGDGEAMITACPVNQPDSAACASVNVIAVSKLTVTAPTMYGKEVAVEDSAPYEAGQTTKATARLRAGATTYLQATPTNSNAPVTWTLTANSDNAISLLDADGNAIDTTRGVTGTTARIKANKTGKATLTVTAGAKTITLTVTVLSSTASGNTTVYVKKDDVIANEWENQLYLYGDVNSWYAGNTNSVTNTDYKMTDGTTDSHECGEQYSEYYCITIPSIRNDQFIFTRYNNGGTQDNTPNILYLNSMTGGNFTFRNTDAVTITPQGAVGAKYRGDISYGYPDEIDSITPGNVTVYVFVPDGAQYTIRSGDETTIDNVYAYYSDGNGNAHWNDGADTRLRKASCAGDTITSVTVNGTAYNWTGSYYYFTMENSNSSGNHYYTFHRDSNTTPGLGSSGGNPIYWYGTWDNKGWHNNWYNNDTEVKTPSGATAVTMLNIDGSYTGGIVQGAPTGCPTDGTDPMVAGLKSDLAATTGAGEAPADTNASDRCSTKDPTTSDTGVKCDVDGRSGWFELANLADGQYTLTETTAPDGYAVNGREYQFTVSNGVLTWIASKTITDSGSGESWTYSDYTSTTAYSKLSDDDKAKVPDNDTSTDLNVALKAGTTDADYWYVAASDAPVEVRLGKVFSDGASPSPSASPSSTASPSASPSSSPDPLLYSFENKLTCDGSASPACSSSNLADATTAGTGGAAVTSEAGQYSYELAFYKVVTETVNNAASYTLGDRLTVKDKTDTTLGAGDIVVDVTSGDDAKATVSIVTVDSKTSEKTYTPIFDCSMATASPQCETTSSTYKNNGSETEYMRTTVRLKLWNSTVSGNADKTSTVRIAQDYAYGIKGLPANATVTAQETSIPATAGGKIAFVDFTGAKPSGAASATECGDDKSDCKTATVTPTPAETMSSKTVTLKGLGTVDSATKVYLPASAVAANKYTPDTQPVTPVTLPNTGSNFGGIWVYFVLGGLILLAGFATYVFDLRRRSA